MLFVLLASNANMDSGETSSESVKLDVICLDDQSHAGIAPKLFYEHFFKDRSHLVEFNRRKGKRFYGTCMLCHRPKDEKVNDFDNYANFKSHITRLHVKAPVSCSEAQTLIVLQLSEI